MTIETLVPDTCGRLSSRSCPHPHDATAADLASTTAPHSPASSTSSTPASPGGCCPPASWAAGARSPAGGACVTGNALACGSACTTSCSTNLAHQPARLVPREPRLAQRPRQARGALTGPNPVDRGKPGSTYHLLVDRCGVPPGGRLVSRQHPRLDAAGSHGRRRAAGPHAVWAAAHPAGQGPCGQGGAPRGAV